MTPKRMILNTAILFALGGTATKADVCDPGSPGAMFMLPVRATGMHFIEGNSITVHPGARVWFEVYACDWDPEGISFFMKTYQFKTVPVDVYGSPSLQPPPETLCQTPTDCNSVYGVGSLCDNDNNSINGDHCEHGFIDTTRPDWIFADCFNSVQGADLSIPVYMRIGATREPGDDCTIDNRGIRYLASFVYDVPIDAPLSPISISFHPLESYMQSDGQPPDNNFPVEKHGAIVQLYPALPRCRHVPLNLPPTAVQEGSTGQALRVTLSSLHHPDPAYTGSLVMHYSSFEGQIRWVGPVGQFTENDMVPPFYYAAPLQCEPHFADWTTLGWLYIYGAEVIPSSTYTVELVDASCPNLDDPTCFTTLFTYTTNRWGDIVEPFARSGGSNQPDFADISAVVHKFRQSATAVPKSRAQLQPNSVDPGTTISFADVSYVVDAFRGLGYTFPGPNSCP